MKLITFQPAPNIERLGMFCNHLVYDLAVMRANVKSDAGFTLPYLPSDILSFLRLGDAAMHDAKLLETMTGDIMHLGIPEQIVTLLSPVPHPTSMRDGYAFRQHVEAARRNRGLDMIPEFDEIPIFYFTNHQAVFGPGPITVRPMHLEQLDFELEVAIVIGKKGTDIPASKADEYIAGFMVMNDWSARAMQMHEMKLNLGPAKGKDFATTLGPWLVTKEELASKKIDTPNGATYDLQMTCTLNGEPVSLGNVKDMSWTFAQIIERASYGVTLHPGDVIGSGTCGTGCFLELNGSKVYDPPLWVKEGDTVVCTIDALGALSNTIEVQR
ncbi:MAG: fumarylacetoacetate hydrolase family protein [Ignavibacteria bacterium]|nr:fumarylacetoacetate hydrolase family protein [Ignavibacteria bacterium]